MFEVRGSVALITGGASGIGLAIAKELLRQEAKAVSLVDISKDGENISEELANEFGSDRVIFLKTDVAHSQQFEDAFENTVKTFGQLDLVFNNAGVVDEINWERVVNVNLIGCIRGTMLATEKFLPKYSKKASSLVVNTSSIAALRPFPSLAVYGATKSGIISFTKSMGALHKNSKIRVIAICPGFTHSNLITNVFEQIPEHYRKVSRDMLEEDYVQTSEILASHTVSILGSAPPGSIWLMEKDEVQQIE